MRDLFIIIQLEEKSIDLEGTRAQLRIIETKKTMHKSETMPLSSSSPNVSPIRLRPMMMMMPSTPITSSQVSTPSMKAMTPLAMDEIHNNSSTESAHDQSELESRGGSGGGGTSTDTPRRRAPSKIPLPGTKGYLAPKPPTGRILITQQLRTSPSGPASNRSLSKSTGSLIGRSGPNSVTKRDSSSATAAAAAQQRPESALSMRKDSSLSSRSSSIPVSSSVMSSSVKVASPMRNNNNNNNTSSSTNSPVPRPKRESLTSRVRNMDSLTRIQSAAASPTISYSGSQKSYSKKDLSTSFSTGQTRDRNQSVVSVRRVSSASVGRGGGGGGSGVGTGGGGGIISSGGLMSTVSNVEPDNGKVPYSRLSRFLNIFKV